MRGRDDQEVVAILLGLRRSVVKRFQRIDHVLSGQAAERFPVQDVTALRHQDVETIAGENDGRFDGRINGNDPPIVEFVEAQKHAELTIGLFEVGCLFDQFLAVIVEPAVGVGDRVDASVAGSHFRLLALNDILSEIDGLVGRPKRDVCFGEVPVHLLD